jgi:hypothetical protein
MDWHVHDEMLADYERGRLDPARMLSVEAHLARCARCRAAVPGDAEWLADSWAGVLDVVGRPRQGPVERLLERLGVPEHRVRLLVATPSLRRSWLLAMAAVLAIAVLSAQLGDVDSPRRLMLFLSVAPLLPVLAVAAAYGPRVDPAHEIASTTPVAGPTLLAWRSIAVLSSSVLMGAVAAVFLPDPGWLAVSWLLPALTLCLATLALATALPLQVAAALLGGCWLAGSIVATSLDQHGHVLFGAGAQTSYLIVAGLATVVLYQRRSRLDPGEPR